MILHTNICQGWDHISKIKKIYFHIINKFFKNKKLSNAVSEIISTMLLLVISVTVVTSLAYFFISSYDEEYTTYVDISGRFSENKIIITHRGGDPINISNRLLLAFGGKTVNITVGDYLSENSKEDGFWNFAEEFIFPVNFDFDYEEYPSADLLVIDQSSNSLIFSGDLDLMPTTDISLEMSISNQYPLTGENVIFTLTVKNNGNINVSSVIIKFNLSEGLIYSSNISSEGIYNHTTGFWNISTLLEKETATLEISTFIGQRGRCEATQLVMILDGSGSISSDDWDLQLKGLSEAIKRNDTFPHDGSIELSVIQFGGGTTNWRFSFREWRWISPQPGGAQVEIDPIIIDETSYEDVANKIMDIDQLGVWTPTACGIYLGADTLSSSSIFDPTVRQVAMIVTDGNPTKCCDCDGDYEGDDCGGLTEKESAEFAIEYLISNLEMSDDQDEIDALAVGESEEHADWLKNNIVWPKPSYFAPPFLLGETNRGWVRNISTWEDFADSINESFGTIFYSQIPIIASVENTDLYDPKEANDFIDLFITVYST